MGNGMSNVSVILPAAGAGRRFGPGEGKIFRLLAGEPVFLRTARLFAGRRDVCQVLLVVAEGDAGVIADRFGETLEALRVETVIGGTARSESVRNALARVAPAAELVCVHDAVRPCVPPACIEAVFAAAARTGAAILAYPVHATLKRVGAGEVVEATVDRAGLWEAQTPQVFQREILQAACAGGGEATDDAALVEAAGHRVSVVPGDPRNIKITTPSDLALAECFVRTLEGA